MGHCNVYRYVKYYKNCLFLRRCFDLGQGIKDIVRWPRPGSPVIQLQHKWAMEYGMPSTHAMVGVSIPFSVLLYTMDRYQYNIPLGLCLAIIWCTLICLSRLYLGMHTVLVSSLPIIFFSFYCNASPILATKWLVTVKK